VIKAEASGEGGELETNSYNAGSIYWLHWFDAQTIDFQLKILQWKTIRQSR
jgi:hypothetical protein